MYVFALRLDSMFELNIFNFGACTQAAKRIFGPRGKRKLPPPPHPILQPMILRLCPPRCVIRKESVQQK